MQLAVRRDMATLTLEMETWLRAFARAVRERDYAAGRQLFDERVDAFGTVSFRSTSRAELERNQWSRVWPNTREFEFDYATAAAIERPDMRVILTGWTSLGLTGGAEFLRRGRATIVLVKQSDDWRAVHTHFSMEPSHDDPLLRRLQ
jgi:ketosteroid isomerase-like protein